MRVMIGLRLMSSVRLVVFAFLGGAVGTASVLFAEQPCRVTQPVDSVAESHYATALKLVLAHKTEAAEPEFEAAWDREPDEKRYIHGVTAFYVYEHQFGKALSIIKAYVGRCGSSDLAYALQGELLFEQKEYKLSYLSLRRALELSNNENYRAHQLIGLIYLLHRRPFDAIDELKTAANQRPDNAEVRYSLARISYDMGEYVQARQEFLECLKISPKFPKALENLGLCYEILGNNAEAEKAYQQAIAYDRAGEIAPSDGSYVDYALFVDAQGQRAQAISLLREGRQRNPESARANFELGRMIFEAGEYDEAEKLLLMSAKLDENFSRPHFFLAKIYKKHNRTREADAQLAIFAKLNQNRENRQARVTGPGPDRTEAFYESVR